MCDARSLLSALSAPLPSLGAVACKVAALAAVEALQPAALGRWATAREVALLTAVKARRGTLGIGAGARHVPLLTTMVARFRLLRRRARPRHVPSLVRVSGQGQGQG